MDISEIINIILSGGLVGTVAAIGSLRATVRKAKAEASKSEADAESVRIDNAEHATRILMENIVKPLKDEFNETKEELAGTKKELARNTREMARLRKAIDGANSCEHRDSCPVRERLREQPEKRGNAVRNADGDGDTGQHDAGNADGADGAGSEVGGEPDAERGQPP